MGGMPDDLQTWFESIWKEREETHYTSFFGELGAGIYPIQLSTFESLGWRDPDPRFLTHGVFECPPNARRGHWLYVSSGMSNPWGASPETVSADAYSGLGYEFTLHTRERARWPILLLHWVMAVQLAVACGEVKGELLQPHDRVPLGGSVGKKDGIVTHLLVLPPQPPRDGFADATPYSATFQLPSGKVDLLLLMGISSREADFARTQGADSLVDVLSHHGFFPCTDPTRVSAV